MRLIAKSTHYLWPALCVAIFVCAAKAQTNESQAKPDFSGTWEFDASRSSFGETKKSSKAANRPPRQIKIIHLDPELRIRRPIVINGEREERELTYYTDGRGEITPDPSIMLPGGSQTQPPETKSQTKWSGDKIVTRAVFHWPPGSIITKLDITIEWRLSPDGKTLTETRRAVTEDDLMSKPTFNTDITKAVYNLVSK